MKRLIVALALAVILPATARATDVTAPGRITDLLVACGKTTAGLSWTAPGDDDYTGTAAEYDVRYPTSPIDSLNFSSATQVTMTAPKPAGEAECLSISGLSSCTTYYFAVKTADEVPNWSKISNLPSCTTRCTLPNTEVYCE